MAIHSRLRASAVSFLAEVNGALVGHVAFSPVSAATGALGVPTTLPLLHASVLGTAWLTAYRALFTKAGLRPGQTVLVQ